VITSRGYTQSMGVDSRDASDVSLRDFREVFDSELPYVWNSLRRLGVHDRDVEDVAHEVFVVVHRRWSSYDPRRALRPWIFGIALRCASDWRRQARHRREEVGDRAEPPANAPPPDEQAARRQMEEMVLRALGQMEDDQRSILVLHDFDEQPMAEIAQAFEIPLQTGYSRLHAAREALVSAARRLQGRSP
jgi:RNA polymerase sigma-70 factor, ECF subfamily